MVQTMEPLPRTGELGNAQRFQKIKAEVHRRLVEMLDISRLETMKPERLRREVRALAIQLARSTPELLNEVERERLIDEVMNETFGLGPLEAFMNDPTVSDILVNGPHLVYIERHGQIHETPVVFADNAHLIQVIQRIAARVGRRVDEMSPMVDARLPDGSRVNAIIPPLSLDGPVLSIRRFGVRLRTEDLIANGTLPPQMLTFLKAVVETRLNMLISGGTGAGKTTMLNTLSRFIPHDERLVTIEDSAELLLQQKHVVRLETRQPNMEGAGQFTQRDLVRNSLRMRPDRIIIGEVRGPEALDMLQAMNTGHEGSLTTIHANDTRDALARLEMMVTMAGFEMPVAVVRHYIASALRVVVQLARLKGGARRVMRVSEIIGLKRHRYYVVRDLFGFRQTGVHDDAAVGEFYATGYVPACLDRLHAAGIDLSPDLFTERTMAVAGQQRDHICVPRDIYAVQDVVYSTETHQPEEPAAASAVHVQEVEPQEVSPVELEQLERQEISAVPVDGEDLEANVGQLEEVVPVAGIVEGEGIEPLATAVPVEEVEPQEVTATLLEEVEPVASPVLVEEVEPDLGRLFDEEVKAQENPAGVEGAEPRKIKAPEVEALHPRALPSDKPAEVQPEEIRPVPKEGVEPMRMSTLSLEGLDLDALRARYMKEMMEAAAQVVSVDDREQHRGQAAGAEHLPAEQAPAFHVAEASSQPDQEIDWAKVEDRTVGGGNLQDTHPQETRLANLGGPEPEDTSSLDAQGEVGPMDKRDEPRPRRRPRTDVAPPYPPPHADDAGGDVS
jgi:pilus assembly protein CpaF